MSVLPRPLEFDFGPAQYHERIQEMMDFLPSMQEAATENSEAALRARGEMDFARNVYEEAAAKASQVKRK